MLLKIPTKSLIKSKLPYSTAEKYKKLCTEKHGDKFKFVISNNGSAQLNEYCLYAIPLVFENLGDFYVETE